MSRIVARAENWETIYKAFTNINFAAFDFNTVKQSLIDYIKLYFPETFNDFIETSELIAIIESFAYIAELLAYRQDFNAHENFLSVAQRKDSVLRLAKFISYTASRPLPARGLVKITSVSTTESIIDASGNNLANTVINWADISNAEWKNQFVLVMNRVLAQEFGTVGPSDRFQLQDVLFEMYNLNLVPLPTGVFTYKAKVNGQSVPMELVPVHHDDQVGIIERRPVNNANFTILYGQDGLGDISDTTGFMCFTKQGTLQRFRATFDGVTPNQTYTIDATNVNDTDVWVNNIDPVTLQITSETITSGRQSGKPGLSGEWVEVDPAHSQNVIFNTNPKRHKYEIETILNNRVRILFGDGEFADVPSGTFDIWARTSLDEDIVIPQPSVVDVPVSFTYIDSFNVTQTFTFTFSLIGSLQNASAAEDIEHIRVNAPAVYYSQDRMVNKIDYNTFMLQDSSILKLRSINRTFAGDSKYIKWHDPSGSYENVKLFGEDGILYFQDVNISSSNTPVVDTGTLINTYIEPLLSSTDIYVQLSSNGVTSSQYRRYFNSTERARLTSTLTPPPSPIRVNLYYNKRINEWFPVKDSDNVSVALQGWPVDYISIPLINVIQSSTNQFETSYTVTRTAKHLVFQSPSMTFWNTNDANRVIDYDTLNADNDTITVLQANTNYNRTGILQDNWKYVVLGQEIIDSGIEIGLPDTGRLSLLPVTVNNVNTPYGLDVNDYTDPMGVADIFKPKLYLDISSNTTPFTITLPFYYVIGMGDVTIASVEGTSLVQGDESINNDWTEDSTPGSDISNTVTIYNKNGNTHVLISVVEYAYFIRESNTAPWVPVETNATNVQSYAIDQQVNTTDLTKLWKRNEGRYGLNFAWQHFVTNFHLVDPAPSNIIDTYLISKGYFLSLKRWLEDPTAPEPTTPTPLILRTSYGYLVDNKMISDEIVFHPGKVKLLFGSRALPYLQANFLVIRSEHSTITDNQIKNIVVTSIRNFFDVTYWEFGESFFFIELAAYIQYNLSSDISSVVLVPKLANHYFGEMFQLLAREDEIFYPDVTVNDISIVSEYNTNNLQMPGDTVTKSSVASSITSITPIVESVNAFVSPVSHAFAGNYGAGTSSPSGVFRVYVSSEGGTCYITSLTQIGFGGSTSLDATGLTGQPSTLPTNQDPVEVTGLNSRYFDFKVYFAADGTGSVTLGLSGAVETELTFEYTVASYIAPVVYLPTGHLNPPAVQAGNNLDFWIDGGPPGLAVQVTSNLPGWQPIVANLDSNGNFPLQYSGTPLSISTTGSTPGSYQTVFNFGTSYPTQTITNTISAVPVVYSPVGHLSPASLQVGNSLDFWITGGPPGGAVTVTSTIPGWQTINANLDANGNLPILYNGTPTHISTTGSTAGTYVTTFNFGGSYPVQNITTTLTAVPVPVVYNPIGHFTPTSLHVGDIISFWITGGVPGASVTVTSTIPGWQIINANLDANGNLPILYNGTPAYIDTSNVPPGTYTTTFNFGGSYPIQNVTTTVIAAESTPPTPFSQTFTTDGFVTVPDGITRIYITAAAGGGGGGPGSAQNSTQHTGGQGGGSGQSMPRFAFDIVWDPAFPRIFDVIVGAGGIGGISSDTGAVRGSDGGNTRISKRGQSPSADLVLEGGKGGWNTYYATPSSPLGGQAGGAGAWVGTNGATPLLGDPTGGIGGVPNGGGNPGRGGPGGDYRMLGQAGLRGFVTIEW